MDEHLGYAKHDKAGQHTGNSRNGYSGKTLKGAQGELTIDVLHDRNGEFEPIIVSNHQTGLPLFNAQIIVLYSKGMSILSFRAGCRSSFKPGSYTEYLQPRIMGGSCQLYISAIKILR